MAICPIFLLNPNLSTICLATRETCIKSFDAPVVTFSRPKITSSATLFCHIQRDKEFITHNIHRLKDEDLASHIYNMIITKAPLIYTTVQ